MFDALDRTRHLRRGAPVHAETVAEWIRETDQPLFDRLHRQDPDLSRRHLAAQWTARRGLHSHAHATAAWEGEELAAVAIGWDAFVWETEEGAHLANGVRATSAWSAARMLVWWQRFGVRVIPPPAPGVFYLAHLAVDPARRGRGVGSHLLQATLDRARERGYAAFQLDVCKDSPAVALYRRAGMKVAAVNRLPELEPEGFPPHLRMSMSL
ncbi:MAG: GNAT family N-acetyltransferase [Pseudomonadota bacterium]